MFLANGSYLVIYLLFALSLNFQYFEKHRVALILLVITAFLLRLVMAHQDPFLHDWDERFHAIVARNMMDDPFKPILHRDPIIPYDYKLWGSNYIWLHKQPLFMWQMALSMKIFGVSEFAIRYPTVLMGCIMVLLNYRIAWLLAKNVQVAYLSAALYCFCHYQLILTSGHAMDHNDAAFGFYVLMSIWAYAEYIHKKTWKWIILIGVFSGCAILNKWLTGLIVYAGWGVNILMMLREQGVKNEVRNLFVSLLACCVIFLPWQVYIHLRFPLEASYEAHYNTAHILKALEGHYGGNLFYLERLDDYFGSNIWILLVAGMITCVLRPFERHLKYALITCFVTIIFFFSFVVQTKMPGYIFSVASLGFIFIAAGTAQLLNYLPANARNIGFVACSAALVTVAVNMERIENIFTAQERVAKIHNTIIYKTLSRQLPPNIKYVFNANADENLDVMFYNPKLSVYSYCPSEKDFYRIKSSRIPIAVFEKRWGYNIPPFVNNYLPKYIISGELFIP